ncbi:MAG TPA: glycosyltransferase family 4 protein [Microthrixaceae bacterium]|nr:glycosyltransferase family 4 protein [Microthrixaceae bacterium]
MSSICIVRHRGYGELRTRGEAEALRDAGRDVHVICMRDDDTPRSADVDGVHVHALPLSRRRGSTMRYLADYLAFLCAATALLTFLHLRYRFDVVQVNTMPDLLVFCSIPAKLMGAKVIAYMKEPSPELAEVKYGAGWRTRVLRMAEQAALRYADLALTVTEELKQTYVSRGADPARIRVVLTAPGADQFPPAPSADTADAASIHDETFTLLCHGAMEERYGHDTILRAVALARHRVPGLRLRLTGEGEQLSRLRELAAGLELEEHVEFLGWVPRDQLGAELLAADVGLVAQESSAYSNLVHTNKMYEYVLFDTPVIATRLKSTAAYFPDECIRYVTPNDPASMADAIVELYEQPERREELVRNARRVFEPAGWASQSALFLAAHEEVMAS